MALYDQERKCWGEPRNKGSKVLAIKKTFFKFLALGYRVSAYPRAQRYDTYARYITNRTERALRRSCRVHNGKLK